MLDHLDDPAGFTPTPEFRQSVMERGRRIRAKRRLTAMITTTIVSASIAVAVLALTTGPAADEDTVVINPTPTTAPPVVLTTGYTVADSSILITSTVGGLSVTPSTGLRDGDAIELHLDPPSAAILYVDICAAEAAQHRNPDANATNPWCGPLVTIPPGADATITATRIVRTPDGPVDCAEASGRCAVAVAVGSKADIRYAPIAFEGAAAADEPRLEVFGLRATPAEGDRLRIVGTGFAPGADVSVAQCLAEIPVFHDPCDEMGRAKQVVTDSAGRVETTYTLFREVGGWPFAGMEGIVEVQPAMWAPCDPCVLQVTSGPHRMAKTIMMAESPSDRPRLELATDGPLQPGDRVRLEGTGFQPSDSPMLRSGGARRVHPRSPPTSCCMSRSPPMTPMRPPATVSRYPTSRSWWAPTVGSWSMTSPCPLRTP